MFDLGSAMAKKFLTSPDGQQMIREFITSPEGVKTIKEILASPEGKKAVTEILLSTLDQLPVPDDTKEIIRQALQGV